MECGCPIHDGFIQFTKHVESCPLHEKKKRPLTVADMVATQQAIREHNARARQGMVDHQATLAHELRSIMRKRGASVGDMRLALKLIEEGSF